MSAGEIAAAAIALPIGVLLGLWFGPAKERLEAARCQGFLDGLEVRNHLTKDQTDD
jgi:hypothetical protein